MVIFKYLTKGRIVIYTFARRVYLTFLNRSKNNCVCVFVYYITHCIIDIKVEKNIIFF